MPMVCFLEGLAAACEELRVPTGQFIPLVENTPQSGMLTYWVLDTVNPELSVSS
jgi:hypothetical protein